MGTLMYQAVNHVLHFNEADFVTVVTNVDLHMLVVVGIAGVDPTIITVEVGIMMVLMTIAEGNSGRRED